MLSTKQSSEKVFYARRTRLMVLFVGIVFTIIALSSFTNSKNSIVTIYVLIFAALIPVLLSFYVGAIKVKGNELVRHTGIGIRRYSRELIQKIELTEFPYGIHQWRAPVLTLKNGRSIKFTEFSTPVTKRHARLSQVRGQVPELDKQLDMMAALEKWLNS